MAETDVFADASPPSMPAFTGNCPPGMEYLANLEGIYVSQHMDLMEMMSGFEMNNKYDILDLNQVRMYLAIETSDFMSRQCLGSDRNFTIMILDNGGVPCLKLQRSFTKFCTCTGNMVTVSTADGMPLGEIYEESCTRAEFSIKDASGNDIMRINGPSRCCCCMTGEVNFPVMDASGQEIGAIHKHWRGYLAEAYTNADTFSIKFPQGLDVKSKCLLLANVFLIDFMMFEGRRNTGNQNRNQRY